MFQFHNGTINTSPKRENRVVRTSFNSTTVQLILYYSDDALFASELFQFHNGTINTILHLSLLSKV